MVLSETRGLWLSSIVRGGIGLRRRLSARRHEKPDNVTGYFTLETERLKNPTATARNGSPGMERTLSQRRSSWNVLQNIPAFICSGALCRVALVSACRSVHSHWITAHKIS